MKTLLVIAAVIAGFGSEARAQNNTKPGQLTGSAFKSTSPASGFFRPQHRSAREGAKLAVSTASESDSFVPFHSSVPVSAAHPGDLKAPVKELSPAELRKKQQEERKTLKEKQKSKPQPENRNTGKAKQAEPRAVIKEQQSSDKTETATPETSSPGRENIQVEVK